MAERNHSSPPDMILPEDPLITVEAQKLVIAELTAKIQFLVEKLDDAGMLEDHAFTFPDGDIWKAQDT
jgi:hypothetical protein